MMGKMHKRISLHGSALFRLTSPARLARILCISPSQLTYLVENADSNYCIWKHPKTGRVIEEPKALLKKVHARMAWLLAQIDTPDYLHSGVKKRSYVTNASGHSINGGAVKLDVQKFFPSVRAAAVCHFFHDVMEYPMDIASRITKLLTFNGHLPTGGNASCILSFWAYKPMFDEIAALAVAHGCHFSLYVDDMTLTGRFATRAIQQETRKIVGRYRLRAHKSKIFASRQPRIITGVAVTARGTELPNRRAKAIAKTWDEVVAAKTDAERLTLFPSLIGRVSEAAEIDRSWDARKAVAVAHRREIRARVKSSGHDASASPNPQTSRHGQVDAL
jgi:RNA-directed DNA polymerase